MTIGEDAAATRRGRLLARPPGASSARPAAAGIHALGLDGGRDGLIVIPTGRGTPAAARLAARRRRRCA
jgi:hypothetical protein